MSLWSYLQAELLFSHVSHLIKFARDFKPAQRPSNQGVQYYEVPLPVAVPHLSHQHCRHRWSSSSKPSFRLQKQREP